jgi:hypothetical protein
MYISCMPVRPKPLFPPSELRSVRALASLVGANPFLAERIALEREALGSGARPAPDFLSATGVDEPVSPNVPLLGARAAELVERGRDRLLRGKGASPQDLLLYESLVLYRLYDRHSRELATLVAEGRRGEGALPVPFARTFLAEGERLRSVPGLLPWSPAEAAHVLACFFQIRRAFGLIFQAIVGASRPAAELRASVWQSIFTSDLDRYRAWFWRRSGDLATLVVGPSGTGKELVARAIAGARYIPFDVSRGVFVERFGAAFAGLNLSALTPTLIESELFGHRRGSFTGATADRTGWLEACRPSGTVFLDEIGELDPLIQVKLLRVLQTRTFERIGDTRPLRFEGKIVAATNRQLGREVAEGRFREDLYYRLCSDVVATPPLADQLRDSPGDLRTFVLFALRRLVGGGELSGAGAAESLPPLVDRFSGWIEKNLGRGYPWPGNVRELEQCVANLLVRGEYRPLRLPAAGSPRELFAREVAAGSLSASELVRGYSTLVYADSGSWQEAARRLAVDRRTVRANVDEKLLGDLRKGG